MYEDITAQTLLDLCLEEVPEDLDKRQGSVIYNVLAAACNRLDDTFAELDNVYENTYPETAGGEFLDGLAEFEGLFRRPGTYSIRKATFTNTETGEPITNFDDLIGTSWALVDDEREIEWGIPDDTLESDWAYDPLLGEWKLVCDTVGPDGDLGFGPLEPVGDVDDIGGVLETVLSMGTDEEPDEDFRERYLLAVQKKAFGGNIPDYQDKFKQILDPDGITRVQGVQVYPTPWPNEDTGLNGGTVGISVIGWFGNVDYTVIPDDTTQNIHDRESWIAYFQWKCDPVHLAPTQLLLLQQAKEQGGLFGLSLQQLNAEIGFAPIDHWVKVVMPTKVSVYVTIDATKLIMLNQRTYNDSTRAEIRGAIESYCKSVNRDWDKEKEGDDFIVKVYRAQIIAAVVKLGNIEIEDDVDTVLIGFSPNPSGNDDLELPQSWAAQTIIDNAVVKLIPPDSWT
jgi:hypothetical protein